MYPKTTYYYTNSLFKKYIHRVNFTNLKYNKNYSYELYLGLQKSKKYNFKIPNNTLQKKILFIGDMGLYNSINLEKFLNIDFDFIFHLGDIAYNLNSYFGMIGDIFLSKMEFLSSKIPYMTIPGNHESFDNFTEYKNRFSMPNYENNVNFFYTIEKPPLK